MYSHTQKSSEWSRLRAGGDNKETRYNTPERLLRTHSTFSKSVMMSMGVSKLGRTYVDAGVKANDVYYY